MAALSQALVPGRIVHDSRKPSLDSFSSLKQCVKGQLKSRFFGSRKVLAFPHSSRSVLRPRTRLQATVSASFFEKLAKLFSDDEEDQEQTMALFEINEGDRSSPFPVKNNKFNLMLALGDFVPYTNKVYDYTAKNYMGISAGLCTVMEHDRKNKDDLFETTMSHYVGKYGHISCQGPYYTKRDTKMAVIGGTGVFSGARGWVHCVNLNGPLKLLYTYHIKGIPKLPAELTRPPVLLEEEKEIMKKSTALELAKV